MAPVKKAHVFEQPAYLSDSSSKTEWEGQILSEDLRIKQYITSYLSWLKAQRSEVRAQRDRLHKDMKKELLIKLGELGWAEEVDKIVSYERYQLDNKLFEKDPKNFAQGWIRVLALPTSI